VSLPRAGVVLDTDVLIDYLRVVPAAGRYVDGLDEVPTCSEVTRVEVLRGMRAHERRATERFLATIRQPAYRRPTGAAPPPGASPPGGRRRGG
jgi:predicted nucleic acid-binding protein